MGRGVQKLIDVAVEIVLYMFDVVFFIGALAYIMIVVVIGYIRRER